MQHRQDPSSRREPRAWRISPPLLLAAGFLALILVGTVLLKLPFATTTALAWRNALFTATSAVTVTGLVVTDTQATFTLWGELVILLLMQAGGLGLMTFAVLALLSLGGRITSRRYLAASGTLHATHPRDVMRTAKEVIKLALIIEGIALVPLALVWVPEHGWLEGLWWSLFHTVSAFNNAGFTLSSDSLMAYAGHPVINTVIPALYLIGGLGFIVIVGILDYRIGRPLDINVKVVLLGTLVLSLAGTAMLYLLEADNPDTLAALPALSDQLWASWLQATTPRTAGFNSLDIGSLTQPTSLVLMLLMFVGAGANGTGSGIKVTTLFVLLAATWAYLRQRRQPTLCAQVIDTTTLLKALAVTVMAVIGIFMGTLALSLTEQADLLTVAFEATSALGTVGLTRGLTPELSGAGQFIIMIMMFVGRVCPLTVAYLVGSAFASSGDTVKTQLQIG
ncbi:TrkH family potassium uptake protein [Halomonas lysinitropha]|uniref:Ktr system potassium uptake protein B n=1 Tax=Halomonas lysinitropha TaxID=2607506 RepID=A0A5K1I1A1_9GAMM|nr:potassium transporter TrkG [Halomonas lysinitropha]VVZ95186.1 Ktr system potassium uptake protein B [Halomonas lysinitropha]